jgi:hypothetical protein
MKFMPLAFLQDKIREYDKGKTIVGSLNRDIKKLREIAKHYSGNNEGDRTYELIKVLLADKRGAKGELYKQLREHESIYAIFKLMQLLDRQVLFTQKNLTNIVLTDYDNPQGLAVKLLKVWELLSPHAQTGSNFSLLLNNQSFLSMPFLTTITLKRMKDEHDLDALISEGMLYTYKKALGTAIVSDSENDLPTHIYACSIRIWDDK